MIDRDFNEINLRTMFENAMNCIQNSVIGRWLIKTKHRGKIWEIVVEPDFKIEVLVVVTAYPVYGEKR